MHLESSRAAILRLCAVLFWLGVCVPGSVFAETRTWSARNGHRFEAELVAADGLRGTFAVDGKPKWVIAVADLSAADAEFVQKARAAELRLPLVDARLLAPWPAEAGAEAEVRLISEQSGEFVYESANFRVSSDLKLSLPVMRDLLTVFESTRRTLIALPLGLHAAGEQSKYPVLMTGSPEKYGQAGGANGSGGHYDARTRRMLVLLPNLGIAEKGGKLELNYAKNLFVLKHEVTHQLLDRWHRALPFWLHEGLPEFIAALPYSRGRYALQNPTAGVRDYLLKWRRAPNVRSVTLIPPRRLMAFDAADWNRAVAHETAYDLYNSAGLLTSYFIQQKGGAPIAGFLAALRRGVPASQAEKMHLLGERTREALNAELSAFGKRLGLEVKFAE